MFPRLNVQVECSHSFFAPRRATATGSSGGLRA